MGYSNETFGKNLRHIRRMADLTQQQLAERAHCDINSITRYENGLITPGLDKAQQLATALGVTLNQLVGMDPLPTGIEQIVA